MGESRKNRGEMNTIASFQVDHRVLEPGVYVSMKQRLGDSIITTFDLRVVTPYKEPVMSTGVVHTIEHIGATFLRNQSSLKDKIIYFGPMGCRTGFYLVVFGDYDSIDILPNVEAMFSFIRFYRGRIPGASPERCGNYKDMDLKGAKILANDYLEKTLINITSEHLHYLKFL